MTASDIKSITREEFDTQVVGGTGAFIVDMWSETCGPCRLLAPIVAKFARELEGRVNVVKLHADGNRDLKTTYDFPGIPTLLFFKDGALLGKSVGFGKYSQVRGLVNNFVASVTGVPKAKSTAAERAFAQAVNSAYGAYVDAVTPLMTNLSEVYNKALAEAKQPIDKALADGEIDEAEAQRRTALSQEEVYERLAPEFQAYADANSPLEAAFIAAVEIGTHAFVQKSGHDTSARVCAIGDPTCRA